MQEALFNKFRNIAYSKAGIDIKPGKEALVSARVAKRLRALQVGSAEEYLNILENETSGEELVHFLDAISTNFTSFFREKDHFELLENILLQWYNNGQRRFRIWCAASSSGEEPYTILMTALSAFGGKDVDFRLLATDISTKILADAKSGIYPESRFTGVSKALRMQFFERINRPGTQEPLWQAKDVMRQRVVFKRLNLSTPPFPMKGPLDMILCRNVMIYFDNNVRQKLVSESERLLRHDGYMMVGHTETLTGLRHGMEVIRPSVYRKP